MLCPVCKTHDQYSQSALKTEGFSQQQLTCSECGSVWSIHHGMVVLVSDTQENSFLQVLTDCVESDDFSLAA
jgi:uncharacterized protein YbaR (Trm112 family)